GEGGPGGWGPRRPGRVPGQRPVRAGGHPRPHGAAWRTGAGVRRLAARAARARQGARVPSEGRRRDQVRAQGRWQAVHPGGPRGDGVGMRLVFAGTPEVALPPLEALLASEHEVVAVVTRPDAPSGRGRKLTPSPVGQRAAELGLEVLKPAKPSDEAFKARLRELAPDLCPVV